MKILLKHVFCIFMLLTSSVLLAKDYQQIQWIDLLPEDDLKALLEDPIPPSILEGTAADKIKSELSMEIEDPISRYEQALVSVRVRDEFNQRAIKLPGYIVPIETDESGRATTFFLVPFFGACLHLPPPPPNQIIYASYPDGVAVDDLDIPYWVEGTLSTQQQSNDMATAAYSAVIDKFYIFKDGDEY